MNRDASQIPVTVARKLVQDAEASGCVVGWTEGKDNSGAPFITVEFGRKGSLHARLTWHTRGTGTYRLFSKSVSTNGQPWRDLRSLKEASELI